MSKKFTRRQIVSSLGISGLGVIGLSRVSRPTLAASTDWTGDNVSQEVSNGTISDVTIPQSNLSFEVAYRGLDPDSPLSVRINARLQTEASAGSNEFDEVGAGSLSLNSTDGTVTESGLSLAGYSFPLKIVQNHSSIQASDFSVVDSTSKTTTVEIQVVFEQENTTETITTAFDVTLSESASFNLSNASYTGTSLDVNSEDTKPKGFAFNSDGTKLFMLGTDKDNVYSYDLSTAYDISTASYTSTSFDVSTQDANPQEVVFNSDGTKLFILGTITESIYEYDLSTAYDITTASYTSSKLDISSEETAPTGFTFNNDGTKLFMLGIITESIYEYDLSTAYDITTASYSSDSLDVSTEDDNPQKVVFNSDGTKLFMLGNGTNNVYEYDLSTAYDITTASYTSSKLDISSEETTPSGLAFNGDRTKLYIVGYNNTTVYSYSE